MCAAFQSIPNNFSREVFDELDDLDQHLYFKWDITSDTVDLHAPVPRKFHDLPMHVENASTMFWTEKLIHPEDRPVLHAYLHTIFRLGRATDTPLRKASCKVRIRHHRGTYLWAEVHLITYFRHGQPVVAFGNLRSIQAQKLWQMRMQQKADQDSLTGLLTKDAAIRQMENYIAALTPASSKEALLLIDADGFKEINDNFGHLFGDGVLTEMGHAIKQHFRQSDIKGRIGGDEFIVLLHHTKNLAGIESHCAALLDALHKSYKSGGRELPFSISMGIALYPEHGVTYRELFKHADRALYEAKSLGKNRYRIYEQKFYQAPQIENTRDQKSTIDLQMRAFQDNMVEFILQMYYETNSADAAITYSLDLLGRLYNLDRAVIAGQDRETGAFFDISEWLGPEGHYIKDADSPELRAARRRMILSRTKPTPYGVISLSENTAELDSASYRAISKKSNFGAYICSLITHGPETIGYISLESTRPRQITHDLIHSLNLFSVLLGNILLPQNAQRGQQRELILLRDILDHLPGAAYAIDKETYLPIYYNRVIRQGIPVAETQTPCYELLHHRKSPCENCPVPRLSHEGQEYLSCTIDVWGEQTPAHACNLAVGGTGGHTLALITEDIGSKKE